MSAPITIKILVRDLYGEKLNALKVGEFLEIADGDGMRVNNFLSRKYKKERLFRILKIDNSRKVFRVK